MKRFIAFDCANKSLAISVIDYNNNWKNDIRSIIENYKKPTTLSIESLQNKLIMLQKIQTTLKTRFIIHYLGVHDLLPGQKVKETDAVYRASQLFKVLSNIQEYINENTEILIEYQMGPNDKSRAVSSQIIYHFVSLMNHERVHIVGPSLKNKIELYEGGAYADFICKYRQNYTANKAHTKANFYKFIDMYNNALTSKAMLNISKKNVDDIADSCMMTLAWIYYRP